MKKKRQKHNPTLKAAYLEAVENQLRDNTPPEARQTFDRLRREGFSEEDAKLLLGSVIAAETYDMLKSGSPYDPERLVRRLHKLPDQSFDDD